MGHLEKHTCVIEVVVLRMESLLPIDECWSKNGKFTAPYRMDVRRAPP